MNRELVYIEEPKLAFGHGQELQDPRDGLTLFGPYEQFLSYSIQAGVIGTDEGMRHYESFVERLRSPILSENDRRRPSFPGFEAVFGISWPTQPTYREILDRRELARLVDLPSRHERTYKIVNFYLQRILRVHREEEARVDVWFIVVPREVWLKCRPKSETSQSSLPSVSKIREVQAGQTLLFGDMQADYEEYARMLDLASDFHHQMKARLIQNRLNIPAQIILEPTLQFKDKYRGQEYEDQMKAHLAWTQSSTAYYKLGKLPWKLAGVRSGVCYLGLVFKRYERGNNTGYACSAAQMFLDSGDGTVFRGNIGPWKSRTTHQYHLDEKSAKDLLSLALGSYRQGRGEYPKEVFIHGRASLSAPEWSGFKSAVGDTGADTRLVGVVIKKSEKLKLFRDAAAQRCRYGNLRGLALILLPDEGFLWTEGFVPRLNTSTSLEVPNPLRIKVDKGEADIKQVLTDVLCLTKLNYNACIHGDGLPVTLRFADQVGSILTAVDRIGNPVLPFKYYI